MPEQSIGHDGAVSNNPTVADPRSLVLQGDPYVEHITARLLDFFAGATPWQRRLWDTGIVMTLRELDEAAYWSYRHVLSGSAIKYLAGDLQRQAGQDRGVGNKELRIQLHSVLKSGTPYGSRHHRTLVRLIDLIQTDYINRWATSFDTATPPSPERLARAVASHLLDCGYSMSYLHRWVKGHLGSASTLGDLLDSAAELATRPYRAFEVVVPFAAIPQAEQLAHGLDEWMSAQELSNWLVNYAEGRLVRQSGGFRYSIQAKDPYSAAAVAESTVDRLRARASYTRKTGRGHRIPMAATSIWVRDDATGICLEVSRRDEPNRGAFVLSLQTERRVYDASRPTALDDALELAAPLNNGAPGPAISGGWAAVEALLVAPGDVDDAKERGVVATQRMAALVTCSWPRAELTALSHRHRPTMPDRLSHDLTATQTNLERAHVVAAALSSQRYLELSTESDRAAQQRMVKLLAEPRSTLGDVSRHVTSAMRRLYRQRNLLMHGGSTGSVALNSTLRTSAPLVGAGLDRLTHAALTNNVAPLDLATRAEVNLKLVGGPDGPDVVRLLE